MTLLHKHERNYIDGRKDKSRLPALVVGKRTLGPCEVVYKKKHDDYLIEPDEQQTIYEGRGGEHDNIYYKYPK